MSSGARIRFVLPSVVLGAGLTAASTSAMNLVLPDLRRDLAASSAQTAWFVVAFLVALIAVLPLAGRIADARGHASVYLCGFAAYAVGSLLCAGAPGPWFLVVARGTQGASAAFIIAATPALAAASARAGAEGSALGWLSSATYAGMAAGPALVSRVLQSGGWRATFLASAVVSAVVVSAGFLSIPSELIRRERQQHPPPLSHHRWRGFRARIRELAAALPGPETRSTLLVSLAVHAALGGCIFMLSLVLKDRLQLAAHASGALWTAHASGLAGAAALAGMASDRIGPRRVSLLAMMVMATGMMGLGQAWSRLVPWQAGLWLVLVGAGAGAFAAATSGILVGEARPQSRGVAGSWLALSRNAGTCCGIGLATAIPSPTAMQHSLAAGALLVLFASVATLLRNRHPVLLGDVGAEKVS
ncbi:MAG: MFS transporter [Deltaproteobacteria bacterium]|nr:MFS transporter [Deltaproteobacteria bacterium]